MHCTTKVLAALATAALAAPFAAHAQVKVFMLGGAVADSNNAIYAGLRAATGKDWSPNTSSYSNCSTNWSTTLCPKIAVITASAESKAVGVDAFANNDPTSGKLGYYNLFQKYGFSPKHVTAHIDNYTSASYSGNSEGDANIALVNQADVVFLNGGDQSRAARTLLKNDGTDSPLMAAIRTRVNSGALIIAGTSAGTMIQGNAMYGEGIAYGYIYYNANLAQKSVGSSTGLRDDRYGTTALQYYDNGGKMTGLGFVGGNVAVDTHCNARGRVARTLAAMRNLGKTQGICVDEDAALYLNGSTGKMFGNNGVSVMDTSAATFPTGSYFRVYGARVTYLTHGDAINMSTKAVTSTKTLITRQYYATPYDSTNVLGPDEITRSITRIVDSTTSYNLGSAPVPVYDTAPTYPASAPVIRMKFYKDANTKGYYSSGRYTAVNVLVDIY